MGRPTSHNGHSAMRASQASASRCDQIDRVSQVAALAATSLFFLPSFFSSLFISSKYILLIFINSYN
jgi:hypothetical protein